MMQPAIDDVAPRDRIRSFVIVSDGSRWFFGKPREGEGGQIILEPAYDYHASTQLSQQGIQRMCLLAPVEMMAGMRSVELHPHTILRMCCASDREVDHFADLIRKAESMRDEIRAAQAGIAIASPTQINGASRR